MKKDRYEDSPRCHKGNRVKYHETAKERGKREKNEERRFFSGGRW